MIITKKTPKIDAASLIAVPAHYSKTAMAEAIAIASNQCHNMLKGAALLSHIWETSFGNLGAIFIPVVDFNLFKNRKHSLAAAVKGVELAVAHGAKCVSFTGMIPAATGYAQDIRKAIQEKSKENSLLKQVHLTTGHAAVVAAFSFNIDKLLEMENRTYQQERVAYIGLGSIGEGILKLMSNKSIPQHIYLVDLKKKAKKINQLKLFLEGKYGEENKITVILVENKQEVPIELYANTTLFLSASSAANIIDVDKFQSGTLLVDDSFPLGFDAQVAIDRITEKQDIKITIAGGFKGPTPFKLLYKKTYPNNKDYEALLAGFEKVANPWTDCMTGCIYSALLTPFFGLPETIGPVNSVQAIQFYKTLLANNFESTPPYFITVGCKNNNAIFVID